MSKKIKALVAVMVAILVLTAGSAAMVMAQDEEPPPPPPEQEAEANPFLQKIAEILGISVEELNSIFQQARQELKQDAFQQFLNRAVEEGRLTQEEADEISAWWGQRPEAADILLQRLIGPQALRGKRIQQQGIMPMSNGQGGWRQLMPPGQAFHGPPPWAGGPQRSGQGGWNPMAPPLPEE